MGRHVTRFIGWSRLRFEATQICVHKLPISRTLRWFRSYTLHICEPSFLSSDVGTPKTKPQTVRIFGDGNIQIFQKTDLDVISFKPWKLSIFYIPSGYDCYSSPWNITIFKNGKPYISMGHLYHGYVTNNQRVYNSYDHQSWAVFLVPNFHSFFHRFLYTFTRPGRGSIFHDNWNPMDLFVSSKPLRRWHCGGRLSGTD